MGFKVHHRGGLQINLDHPTTIIMRTNIYYKLEFFVYCFPSEKQPQSIRKTAAVAEHRINGHVAQQNDVRTDSNFLCEYVHHQVTWVSW